MEKKINIEGYLQNVDNNFSGIGGMDIDDMYFSGADAQQMAAPRMAAPRTTPNPYKITVVNSTAGSLTAVLFGLNQYLLTTNFGSGAGLVLTTGQPNVTYLMLLQQSAQQPFETSLIRIQSTNATQVTQTLTVQSTDANGQTCSVPVDVQSSFSANQFQSGIVDVPYSVTIDGNTNIQSTILAGATVVYAFFPKEKVNTSRALGGRNASAVKQYSAPSVPIITNEKPSSYPQGNY